MIFKNKTNQKLISLLLLISAILPSILFLKPQKAEAFWWSTVVTDANTGVIAGTTGSTAGSSLSSLGVLLKNVAKEIIRQTLMTIARRALQEMTKTTINWINSGYWGNPLFVENPESFFKDIAKSEIKNLVDTFGYDSRRFPFGRDFALNTINSYKSQLATNAEYTLSRVINDPVLLQRYRTDFSVGGWNGFLINTQYPQNNYIGFQMLATEELARRLEGTVENKAQKVRTALDQGMGFLSPQTCPSNPNYPAFTNPNNPPAFRDPPYDPQTEGRLEEVSPGVWVNRELQAYNDLYNAQKTAAKAEWERRYSCPNGFVSTTPGSVVGDQIKGALGSGQTQRELAAAMGNSVSAIVDTLLDKFIGDGLNALATRVNPQPQNEDNWDYLGNTLGSPVDGRRVPWDAGPDEPIYLDKFTDAVREGIANTDAELKLMYFESTDLQQMGISQVLSQIWPKTRELDFCLPGPNKGWEERLQDEVLRNNKQLVEKTNESDAKKAVAADLSLKELKFAVNFFQDWVKNKMMSELPSSVLFMDAIDEIEDLSQQGKELTNKRRAKTQALARLNAILGNAQNGLLSITTQPAPGSQDERRLIEYFKQYQAIQYSISNTSTTEDSRNELNVAKEKWFKLNKLLTDCKTERTAKDWTPPEGGNPGSSTLTPRGSSGGGVGACVYLMTPTPLGNTVKGAKVKQAMEAVLPQWQNSRDVRGFKDAVVDWLNRNGEVAMRGWNGNCNSSDNNLAIKISDTRAEMFEVARDGEGCGGESNPTLGESTSCRPAGTIYTSPLSYQQTGQKPASSPAPSSNNQMGLAVESNYFRLNGQAKFLVLAGYFDGMDAPNPTADLDYLKSKGIDGIRIFPNWWNWAEQSDPVARYNNNPLFNANGTIKADRLTKLKGIIEAAAGRGMVVDVSFARETVAGTCTVSRHGEVFQVMCEPEYKNAVVATANALKNYNNIMYDLQNEFDSDLTHLSPANVVDLKNRIEAIDSDVIISVSSAVPDGAQAKAIAQNYNMDIINAHFASDLELSSDISKALGTKPAYNGEPYHTISLTNDPDRKYSYSGQDLINAVAGAKRLGLAAWTFHTDDNFILDGSTLENKLGAIEKSFLNGFKNNLDNATWAITPAVATSTTIPSPSLGTTTGGFTTGGTEQALFCDNPIKGGYTHETFVNRTGVTHPEIPLVNANDVLKWRRFGGIFGNYTADIKLECKVIFRSNVLDYKGDLPGLTTIVEPYESFQTPEDQSPEGGPAN